MEDVKTATKTTLRKVGETCDAFTSEFGVEVTDSARQQIVKLINCILDDPHEEWEKLDGDRIGRHFQFWERYLFCALVEILDQHKLKTRISTMDIVVWIGNNPPPDPTLACRFPEPAEGSREPESLQSERPRLLPIPWGGRIKK
jgi:hypothetical protein